ncbi:MAG TPA: 2-phospho-L-lactate guanylyltransferase [Acidimicrobiales bacterium]|jgi:2-phospho-L-lactate guanylyltransferase|nr:2-phospho-L-lactate guanylyltransferase [Acidimicrobiales bacterium]
MPDASPHTAAATAAGRAVLVPVKAFNDAKHRLAESLDPDARSALARDMATRVVQAANGVAVFVVCDDEAVAGWATEVGARVLWRPGTGLNAAVSDGVAALAELGVSEVIVAHADLPFAEDLTVVTGFEGVTLVPDRHDDGTNVACVPTGAGFRFAYGPGSFARHCAEATRLGLPLRVLHDAALAWDVDVPADLPASRAD